jgi:hypothetical protein
VLRKATIAVHIGEVEFAADLERSIHLTQHGAFVGRQTEDTVADREVVLLLRVGLHVRVRELGKNSENSVP